MEIRNIEQLLSSYLQDGKKLVNYKQQKLLAAGENYGSVMLRVELFLMDKNGKEEVIKCVAKLVPPRGVLWRIFNTVVSFKKEIAVYTTIAPVLNEFGREHGIECLLPFFAEYYSSRTTLIPNKDDVDDDAVLLLRNLREDGYFVEDRFVGFDRDTMIMLMKTLAAIQASTIAYREAKPTEFQKNILAHIGKCYQSIYDDKAKNAQIDYFKKFLSKYPKINHLSERMVNGYSKGMDNLSKVRTPNDLFTTITHGDLWTNNILIKTLNGKPISTKFVDFQVVEYADAARDIVFLFYTSAQIDILPLMDDMLLIYYNHFIDTLKKLHCETAPFTYDLFLKQIDETAREIEFGHIMFILPPIFTEKGKAKELSEMKDPVDVLSSADRLHENFFPRFAFLIEDFAKRGWI